MASDPEQARGGNGDGWDVPAERGKGEGREGGRGRQGERSG
jgi:hypothetical protein